VIAARASTPLERFQYAAPVEQMTAQSDQQARQRVQHLATVLGADDEEGLGRFLASIHLDRQQLSSFLASPDSEGLGFQPSWIEVLEQVVLMDSDATSQLLNASARDRACFADDPIPFEEVLLPFLRYAREQCFQGATLQGGALLAEQAQVTLERWLLQRLVAVAAEVLQLEFSLFRAQYALWGLSPERRECYQAFVARYQGEGLLSLFQEYSVLARLLIVVMEQWIEACREFLQRLNDDLDAISQQLHDGSLLGPVIQVQAGCSDPHQHGRSVLVVAFAAGLKVVYKPKNLKVDQAFFDLLTWCNTSGLTAPRLKPLRVLNRGNHGWMEYAEHTSCATQQEVEDYYRRAGMLLCLLYVLGGTDMHYSNVIACGEHPLLIDLETVTTPGYLPQMWSAGLLAHSPQSEVSDCLWHTVLRTSLLPEWSPSGEANHACDISGLGGVEGHTHTHPHRRWKHINTDAMGQEIVEQPNPISQNTVLLQGIPQAPFAYVEQVVTGFRGLYLALAAHESELHAPQGPLSTFEDCRLRFVCRGTRDYWNALDVLNQPAWLREGTDRWIEMQTFKQPWLIKRADPKFLKLAAAEIHALERLDIPWFGTTTSGYDLSTDGVEETIANLFPVSALQQVRARLARLHASDIERQTHLIRMAFLTARPTDGVVQEDLSPLQEEAGEQKLLTIPELVEEAEQIAQQLQAYAFPESSVNGTWMGLQYREPFKSFGMQPAGFDLYEGACGIALFLALLDHITGQNQYGELVTSALQPLCQDLARAASSPTDLPRNVWPIGGADGLGSFIYALSHIGTWLHLPALHEAARHAAMLLSATWVQQDESFDVIGGGAGAILGLLCLYETTGDQQLIEQALGCGHHLLQQRVATQCGARSWPGLKKRPLTGFSHGAAGIAYALLRLYTVSGQNVFREAAEEAVSFEQDLFSPEVGNWPDLRELSSRLDGLQASVSYGQSWCHGAPGIGLARLGGLEVLDTPQVRRDLTVALQTTQAIGLSTLDTLCCGNFGRIELLIAASQRLHQPQWLEIARQWSSAIVHRARQQGGFRLFHQLSRQVYNPGLFQGTAGIGYQLLRVAFPERVPSVLLWE
jgi:type 2 lantibiotic biosynthesis protein LanM